ncbi:MAG: alpha-glucan family phosphorylase [Gemmatimonadetes bacterium]|uniref:Alpha-glucan family phosphorylase n=1 Tax=Candidatus Kutchimonas denitrificans TaxID=3056748 RepID=A0AAE4ZBZ1_9BACT|nr:alpha-glucan family phosphorylase [Gemmatimonadota bacterium]NIR76612.1 alpha-glucan family phosphorylase [Candidatus Kutchimonas denitrificans]NIS03381.1 alpha-glucan family phosphorylase [Gemmatimonadota bacterium]NIT69242.1 alpha-glucan family phosphorylase [Gemmatimonadota bacterium]NIU54714.1 alpha-glucan family phosphorylase [Gemmatimonadota bacterium]
MNFTSVPNGATVAYFSMEIALDPDMPTYSGGLGVLAGDILRSAADLGVGMVGVTLIHRKGYFRQHLDEQGTQTESPHDWSPEERLQPLDPIVTVEIEGREVKVRVWRFEVRGRNGHIVPVLLLDTALPDNTAADQTLTDHLYGGDERYRLIQETILGIGGVEILRALGQDTNLIYHMNEGHSSLLTLALLEHRLGESGKPQISDEEIEAVRKACVFTTHTPVPAGHDQFPRDLVTRVLGERRTERLEATACLPDDRLNMTYLGLRFSRYINGVSMRHGEVSLGMFPEYPVEAITNGVHVETWAAEPIGQLLDRYIPDWRDDNRYLRYAIKIPLDEIQHAHAENKRRLLQLTEERTGVWLDEGTFTIGFARRATPYKRAELLLSEPERLEYIAESAGPLQIIFGGKAHPNDGAGKDLIRHIFEVGQQFSDAVRIVYLEDYGWKLARLLTAGTDLWLNTPAPPREASGTSGMKAACNGVPSLSILDGWWVEGHIERVTGWAIAEDHSEAADEAAEIAALYDKLEHDIVPMYYDRPTDYARVMRSAIALNASFFNTQRVVSQYLHNAYSD